MMEVWPWPRAVKPKPGFVASRWSGVAPRTPGPQASIKWRGLISSRCHFHATAAGHARVQVVQRKWLVPRLGPEMLLIKTASPRQRRTHHWPFCGRLIVLPVQVFISAWNHCARLTWLCLRSLTHYNLPAKGENITFASSRKNRVNLLDHDDTQNDNWMVVRSKNSNSLWNLRVVALLVRWEKHILWR